MLFKFSFFWKFVSTLVTAWILYGLCGYEFTIVTILACILALKFQK